MNRLTKVVTKCQGGFKVGRKVRSIDQFFPLKMIKQDNYEQNVLLLIPFILLKWPVIKSTEIWCTNKNVIRRSAIDIVFFNMVLEKI